MNINEQARTTEGNGPRRTAAKTPAPSRGIPAGLLALQSTAGNAAVVQMLRSAGHAWAQPEQHQHGAGCGHQQAAEQPAVQRSAVHDVLRTSGRPLDEATRTDMESRLGADFSDVRIHNDSAAKASATEVGARAYTSGNHVVIGDGGADKHTLAHELTHVIQQRQGPVSGTDNGSGLKVSDPSDRYEREAEANATRVMGSSAPVQRSASAPARHLDTATSEVTIQRVKTCACSDPYCQAGERCDHATPTYMIGQHGIKGKEQDRLGAMFNTTVNGTTHQSEHVFGYRVLQGDSSLRREGSAAARDLENTALAYQELHAAHRAHVGTGRSSAVGPAGFNSTTYRDDTRSLLTQQSQFTQQDMDGRVSAAAQINTLGYTFNQTAPLDLNAADVQAMNQSHLDMVRTMDTTGVRIAGRDAQGNDAITTLPVSWNEQWEMRTAHWMRLGLAFADAKQKALEELT